MNRLELYLAAVMLVISGFSSYSQQLPLERITDWTSPGASESLPVYDTLNVLDYGLKGDGKTPNDAAFSLMLSNRYGSATVFSFPSGEFLFNQTVQLRSGQVLKGASANQTRLVFDLKGGNNLIEIKGTISNEIQWLSTPLRKDSTAVRDTKAGNCKVGDYMLIIGEDSTLVTSSWARFSTGQINKVIRVSNDKIDFNKPFRKSVSLSDAPRIIKIIPIEFAGIECLGIERKDKTANQTSNIFFDYAANCWIRGVNSYNCNFSHTTIQNSSQISVSSSHFSGAFDYGGGGRAYGVVLQFNTGDCLIENNIFKSLRHSILLQAGANGNVISYNYSREPFWTGTSLPSNSAGDLVLHGNYPYLNLFEGNIVQNIVIDDSHGANGPGNAFFRNRVELYGIFMNNNPASPGQLFIANEITSTAPLTGLYWLSGGGHFELGNNVRGNLIPANSPKVTIASLYSSATPNYFQTANLTIGNIGNPSSLNLGINPAFLRFIRGEKTSCESSLTPVKSYNKHIPSLMVWPNPASEQIAIQGLNFGFPNELNIYSATGEIAMQKINNSSQVFDVSKLETGYYTISIKQFGRTQVAKFLISR